MIDKEFENILKKMFNEHKELFLGEINGFRSILSDCTLNAFPKERERLIKMQQAGCIEHIYKTDDYAKIKDALVKKLDDDFDLSPSKSIELLDLLFRILKSNAMNNYTAAKESTPNIQTVKPIPIPNQQTHTKSNLSSPHNKTTHYKTPTHWENYKFFYKNIIALLLIIFVCGLVARAVSIEWVENLFLGILGGAIVVIITMIILAIRELLDI